MIGNDIIDLQLAAIQSNWQRTGFLDKIFTVNEQKVISNSEDPFQTVWLFWSMKESAYKAYVQKYNNRFFAPRKFECTLTSSITGKVVANNECYTTFSHLNSRRIFTEAIVMNSNNTEHPYFEIGTRLNKSQMLYLHIMKVVSKKLSIPLSQLRISKNAIGIPTLYKNNEQVKVSISISHHGNFGAFSILNKS